MGLEERFKTLCGQFNADPEKTAYLSKRLIQTYSDPKRKYHNLDHIDHCLKELDQCPKDLVFDRQSVELAIFYHDLVYDPKRTGNEEQSAKAFEEDFKDHLPTDQLSKVSGMILASKHLSAEPFDDPDFNLFLDIDLSILGASKLEFLKYEKGIRAEYRGIPSFVFFPQRKRFLKKLLKRRIFRTEFFYEKYEMAAKDNIFSLLRCFPYFLVP